MKFCKLSFEELKEIHASKYTASVDGNLFMLKDAVYRSVPETNVDRVMCVDILPRYENHMCWAYHTQAIKDGVYTAQDYPQQIDMYTFFQYKYGDVLCCDANITTLSLYTALSDDNDTSRLLDYFKRFSTTNWRDWVQHTDSQYRQCTDDEVYLYYLISYIKSYPSVYGTSDQRVIEEFLEALRLDKLDMLLGESANDCVV
jgi:hypothetical protein